MIPIACGQAIEISSWPPSPVIHACWFDDAMLDNGELVIVAACGAYAAPEDVHETDAAIDCMTCLVRADRSSALKKTFDRLAAVSRVLKEFLYDKDKDAGADDR